MNREDSRHKSTSPEMTGHRAQQREEQQHRTGMKQDVCEMVSGRIQAEELTIEHVGKRGERVPIARMWMSERAPDALGGEASADHRILGDVIRVVVGDELVLQRLPEDEPHQARQTEI